MEKILNINSTSGLVDIIMNDLQQKQQITKCPGLYLGGGLVKISGRLQPVQNSPRLAYR